MNLGKYSGVALVQCQSVNPCDRRKSAIVCPGYCARTYWDSNVLIDVALVQIAVLRRAELPRRCASTMIGGPRDWIISLNLAAFGTFSVTYVMFFFAAFEF